MMGAWVIGKAQKAVLAKGLLGVKVRIDRWQSVQDVLKDAEA